MIRTTGAGGMGPSLLNSFCSCRHRMAARSKPVTETTAFLLQHKHKSARPSCCSNSPSAGACWHLRGPAPDTSALSGRPCTVHPACGPRPARRRQWSGPPAAWPPAAWRRRPQRTRLQADRGRESTADCGDENDSMQRAARHAGRAASRRSPTGRSMDQLSGTAFFLRSQKGLSTCAARGANEKHRVTQVIVCRDGVIACLPSHASGTHLQPREATIEADGDLLHTAASHGKHRADAAGLEARVAQEGVGLIVRAAQHDLIGRRLVCSAKKGGVV